MKPYISVIIPTNRVGGLDILFESLKKQTFQDFELILVDAIFSRRKSIVEEKSKQYSFAVKHIEPIDNTFPVSNYCRSINTGLCAAEGTIVYLTCDYGYLDPDTLQTHANFQKNTPPNHALLLPTNVYGINDTTVSNNFPRTNQYGLRGEDEKYKLLIAPEEIYVGGHNLWSDNYASDIAAGLLDKVLWSIFETPVDDTHTISHLIDDLKIIDGRFTHLPPNIVQEAEYPHLCGLKNDSFKHSFLMSANGLNEDMDGAHGFQDTELSRRLAACYGGKFFGMNKTPVSIVNIRQYLEIRKLTKGYNNHQIIVNSHMRERPLTNNTITKFKASL